MQTLRNRVWRKNIGDERGDSDILLDGGSFEDELCRRTQCTHSLPFTFGNQTPHFQQVKYFCHVNNVLIVFPLEKIAENKVDFLKSHEKKTPCLVCERILLI